MPINLFPGKSDYKTPWHSSCALELDGTLRYAHAEEFSRNPMYEKIYLRGKPSYFRKKSELFQWPNVNIEIEPIYPCGLLITPKDGEAGAFMKDIPMRKVRKLAELNSPIVLRGFQSTKDLPLFMEKAHEMGSIMPWKFGNVLVVKDTGIQGGGLNNVLSAEPMPMHFDGLFKTAKTLREDGVEALIPQPPRYESM